MTERVKLIYSSHKALQHGYKGEVVSRTLDEDGVEIINVKWDIGMYSTLSDEHDAWVEIN